MAKLSDDPEDEENCNQVGPVESSANMNEN